MNSAAPMIATLAGRFSVGDLLVADVWRRLGGTALLAQYRTLAAYVARAEARPAFGPAFDAQSAFFNASRER